MKTLLVLAAIHLVFVIAFPPLAAAAAAVPEIITETEREHATLRDALKTKKDAVEAAITRASKAGTLKVSTEAYFRDALEGFRPLPSGLPDFARLYFPPRFDASEDMEPINKAWADLKGEATRAQVAAARQRALLLEAAANAVRTAGRTAQKPDQLAEAEQLTEALRKFSEALPKMESYPQTLTHDELLTRTVGAIRAALDASEKKDLSAAIAALQRIQASEMRFRSMPLPMETFWDEFRQRTVKNFAGTTREAQLAAEKAFTTAQPPAEVDRLIAEFDERSREMEMLARDPNRPDSSRPSLAEVRMQVTSNFRAILFALAGLKSGQGEIGPKNTAPPLLSEGMYGLTEEFRNFVADLTNKRALQREAVEAAYEKRNREQQRAAEQARIAEQRELTAKILAEVRAKILAVASPQEAMALSEELPQKFGAERMDLQTLQMELMQLAAWWADPAGQHAALQAMDSGRAGASPLALEMRRLRERVTREVVAEKLGAPEVRQPPLAELPVKLAVGKIADDAGERGDWKRAYELVRAIDPGQQPWARGMEAGERMPGMMPDAASRVQAIHAYLSGQNFEKAEQFREAIAAYQVVLQNVADRVPTAEAAERLKALKKAHPEAFTSPSAKGAATAPSMRDATRGIR